MIRQYFGRVDFIYDGDDDSESIYIGVYGFDGDSDYARLIYDWRAPVSSLFYDCEKGEAFYEAPMGELTGKIELKRQYKIKDSEMQYMFDSSINVNDEILQMELSHTSDEKMKNIVSTIQKEQNVIIRNDRDKEMIIQGVAGSGKTSIALHRIAYILYRNRKTIEARNILIISPNDVFSDYISMVLPELDEEQILTIKFDDIAKRELGNGIKYCSQEEQINALFNNNEGLIERIRYKSSKDVIEDIDKFIAYVEEELFNPKALTIKEVVFTAEKIASIYNRIKEKVDHVTKRIDYMCDRISEILLSDYAIKLGSNGVKQLKEEVMSMIRVDNLITLYTEFYSWIGKKELLRFDGKKVEYSDVFLLLYIKLWYSGMETFDIIKHLVIDEMQDYSVVQYKLLERMFRCDKTILGDCSQKVNYYSSTTIDEISGVFPKARKLYLTKSYRSTVEIINFAKKIIKIEEIDVIDRHGDIPNVFSVSTRNEEVKKIKELLHDFVSCGYSSACVICKTSNQANEMYLKLKDDYNVAYITSSSNTTEGGIIVTTAFMAKGLEFDYVIVVDVDEENYKTEFDYSMLYVACTRAMHKLDLIHVGKPAKVVI